MTVDIVWKQANKQLSQDKYLSLLIKRWGKCAIKKTPPELYFKSLVESICSQQLSIKAASTIFKRLEEKLLNINAKNILTVEEDVLRSCGLSGSKVGYIKDLASRVDTGKINLERLDKMNDEEVVLYLTQIKGVGPWTCQMLLMFDLGREDIFPVDDLGIRKAMIKILKKDLDKDELLKFSERWKPYRTVASWYLWRSLDNS